MNLPGACAISIYGASHKSRAEHILITDIQNRRVGWEIHHQWAHNRIIVVVGHTGQRIYIRHQPITQIGIIYDRCIGRVAFGRYIIYFAIRILSMRTENRHKRPELEPACIQLAPLFQVGIFLAGLIELFKSRLITFFHAESADVHRPIRDTTDREIQSRRYLGFHIFPTRRYIATPCGRRIPL